MTCIVPDFTEVVEFQCNGSSRGACTIFGCSPNIIKEGGNTVILQIPSLSYTNDACEWTCTYGATSSPATKLIIYSKYGNYIIKICGIKKKLKKSGIWFLSHVTLIDYTPDNFSPFQCISFLMLLNTKNQTTAI